MPDGNAVLPPKVRWGAREIALALFGNDDARTLRRTFKLLEDGRINAVKMGNVWTSTDELLFQPFVK
jgi:hypothetical protein